MRARYAVSEMRDQFARRGINAEFADVAALRRAQMTLHRWCELECGDGDNYKSWAIERDEQTEKPFMCIYPHDGKIRRYSVPDREKGAIKRIQAICKRLGIHYYYQTDPRGCALYVSPEPITDQYYNRGIPVCD